MPRPPTTRPSALFVLVVMGALAGAPLARAQVDDTGFNRPGWFVPWAVFVLCLGMVFVVGRRWVIRGRQVTAARLAAASAGGGSFPRKSGADEARKDRLDDELRDLD